MKMKKYLITGALALVACATLTSCHSDDELSGSLVQQKIKAYEQVFEEEFGKVDPNQDWGFGTAELLARTRTADADRTRMPEGSGSYPNANMWAEEGWTVPTELTAAQKLRVTRYFQTHKNPGSTPNYGNMTYFVQQVYDGGDDPITKYDGYKGTNPNDPENKPYSTEVYKSADNNDITSGEHMDHLTVGYSNTHLYNFNNGTYGTNGEPNHDVQNSENVVYHSTGNATGYHSDQIMLMYQTDTYPWAYANSDDSYVRNDRWTLVSAHDIDEWAKTQDPAFVGNEIVDDIWHRSFIGFDFDQLPDENCFKRQNEQWDYQANPQKLLSWDYVYAPFSDLPEQQVTYAWDGQNVTAISGTYIKVNNKEIPYLVAQQNAYCGHAIGINNTDNLNDYPKFADYSTTGENNASLYLNNVPYGDETVTALNLKFIKRLVDNKYLPVDSKNLQKWVQVGGCNDGYYSDWIISFLPGEGSSKTDEIGIEPGTQGGDKKKDMYYKQVSFDRAGSGRVFCEDLGVVRASDIDFNDIVFDVRIYKTEYITYHMIYKNGEWVYDTTNYPNDTHRQVTSTTYDGDVWLLAGGGTIPATIQAGGNNYNVKNTFESGLSNKIIVNTIEDDAGRYGNQYKNYTIAKKLNDQPLAITSVADVKVFVTYGAEFAELVAYKGVAPHKISVPLTTKWPKEREEISNAYPDFTKYVKYQDADGTPLTNYVNNPGVTENKDPKNPGYVGDGEEYEFDERANTVWDNKVTASLYRPDVTYTPRDEEEGWNGTEQFIREQITSNGGTSSGYQSTDPVLIRVRH